MTIDYPTPDLRSDRVVLRKWSMDDLECVKAASRAGYSRGSTLPVNYTNQEGRAWIERQWSKQQAGRGLSMAVTSIDTNDAFGMIHIGLGGIEGHGTLGYWLVPEVHRLGFGSEAVNLVSSWILDETDVYRIVAYVEPDNRASIALLHTCGFTEEGLLRSFLLFDDEICDALVFSLLVEDLEGRT